MPIQPTTLTESMMYATVRIETHYQDGKTGSGTGFGYAFLDSNKDYSYSTVATAAHVLKGVESIRITFHTADTDGKVIGAHVVQIENVQTEVLYHSTADLCLMDFRKIYEREKAAGNLLFLKSLDSTYVQSQSDLAESFSAVEDVLMFGYPLGLSDNVNNYPIFRKGISASHVGVDFQGFPKGAIDIACFPGSSGSPVAIMHEGGPLVSKGGSTMMQSEPGAVLLGVLTDGYVLTDDMKIEIAQIPTTTLPSAGKGKFVVHNLGLYTKATELQGLYSQVESQFLSQIIDYGPPPKVRKLERLEDGHAGNIDG